MTDLMLGSCQRRKANPRPARPSTANNPRKLNRGRTVHCAAPVDFTTGDVDTMSDMAMNQAACMPTLLFERRPLVDRKPVHGVLCFSQQFGWVNDRFGVSWQLNLA